MKKKEIKVEVPNNLDWEYQTVSIDSMIKELQELKDSGANYLEIDCIIYYDCPSLKLTSFFIRDETDEELRARIEEKDRLKKLEEERERAMLKTLKEKYE